MCHSYGISVAARLLTHLGAHVAAFDARHAFMLLVTKLHLLEGRKSMLINTLVAKARFAVCSVCRVCVEECVY